MSGPPPKPTALRRAEGNRGKRGYNHHEPVITGGIPDCPAHLGAEAQVEWHRLAEALHEAGVLTFADRAALAAYCQCYGRWVEAEERLAATPTMLKTPSGYVQQSPWLAVANKQLELMGRYMAELGLTPAARSRIVALRDVAPEPDKVNKVEFVVIYEDAQGRHREQPLACSAAKGADAAPCGQESLPRWTEDGRMVISGDDAKL